MADNQKQKSAFQNEPHASEAERTIIGCILLEQYQWIKVLTPEHFFDPVHKTIFTAMTELKAEGKLPDFLEVANRLQEVDEIQNVGGSAYLADCATIPSPSLGVSAARLLQDFLSKRTALKAAVEIKSFVEDSKDVRKLPKMISDIGQKITSLIPRALQEDKDELVAEMLTKDEMISTGYPQMDSLLGGGFIAGGLFLIAARPKVGKTALATNLFTNLLQQGIPTLFISLEMSRKQIMQRLLCSYFQAPKDEVIAKAADLIPRIETPFHISVGTHGINQILQDIYTTDAKIVIIDYFGLITTGGKENRFQQMDDISRSIKNAARESEKPVILLTQMNRDVEKDKVPRQPRLSDLWGGGEKDADVISFLHNPTAKDELGEELETAKSIANNLNPVGELEWIVRANRHGPSNCYVKMEFVKNLYTMREMDTFNIPPKKDGTNDPF